MTDPYALLALAAGFEWDDGNDTKNWKKHSVTTAECEEIFFAEPLIVPADVTHSEREARYAALGQSAAGRQLFLIFTLRETLIRVISTRPMSRRERGCIVVPKTKKATKPIPAHKSEAAERAFWENAESSDYVDWSSARRVRLPALKPSTTTISLRLPDAMLDQLKVLANARDVPYQSLLKVFLAERLAAERGGKRRAS